VNLTAVIGTSIGAFIGGLYAREGDILSAAGRAKHFSGRMGNVWRILSDVTYPLVAYTTVRIHASEKLRLLTNKLSRGMNSTELYTRYIFFPLSHLCSV
jgi:predicted acylesterase/phospholipase RssA